MRRAREEGQGLPLRSRSQRDGPQRGYFGAVGTAHQMLRRAPTRRRKRVTPGCATRMTPSTCDAGRYAVGRSLAVSSESRFVTLSGPPRRHRGSHKMASKFADNGRRGGLLDVARHKGRIFRMVRDHRRRSGREGASRLRGAPRRLRDHLTADGDRLRRGGGGYGGGEAPGLASKAGWIRQADRADLQRHRGIEVRPNGQWAGGLPPWNWVNLPPSGSCTRDSSPEGAGRGCAADGVYEFFFCARRW